MNYRGNTNFRFSPPLDSLFSFLVRCFDYISVYHVCVAYRHVIYRDLECHIVSERKINYERFIGEKNANFKKKKKSLK